MHRIAAVLLWAAGVFAALAAAGCAVQGPSQASPKFVADLFDKVKPSLVCVKYTYAGELIKVEVIGQGVVIGDDGLVMASSYLFPNSFADSQLTDFKIVIPGDEEKEFPAVFQGRDDRSNVAFIRTVEKQHWTSIKFADVPITEGEDVVSIGLLPKSAGYHPYLTQPTVSAILRGPLPMVMVSTAGLTTVGSPVFNSSGQAIGLVNHENLSMRLNRSEAVDPRDPRTPPPPIDTMAVVQSSCRIFVPARDFLASMADPPSAGHPLAIPWLGLKQLTGLKAAVAEYYKLKGQPAVQVGAVIPNTPAEKAGFKTDDIIVKMNGKPLDRGDEPDETGMILVRQVQRMKVGEQVVFSVLRTAGADQPLADLNLTLTLEQRPMPATLAKRYYVEDTGFVVRELVFDDRDARQLTSDFNGLLVASVKNGGAASGASLQSGDVLTQFNGQAITDIQQFEKFYKEFRHASPKEAIVLEVLRKTKTETIRIEPPQ